MKPQLQTLLSAALEKLQGTLLHAPVNLDEINIERCRDPLHGDWATNIALRLAKAAGQKPRELALAIVAALPANTLIGQAEVAGAGFINFRMATGSHAEALRAVLTQADAYGTSNAAAGERVLLEFVSANPTGPLHVGHGRQAAWGATLANLLRATGHAVEREYYINDAGRQVDILTCSVWLRYLELFGEQIAFPQNGYRGEYVRTIGEQLRDAAGERLLQPASAVFAGLPEDAPAGDKEKYIDALIERMRALLGAENYASVKDLSLARMLELIRTDLAEFGVHFERWYSERELARDGAIERCLARLEAQQHLYRKDGALWFHAKQFGDDEDRVVVRANGEKTYFASDIAYHLEKRERGFARLIDVLGADHHGYVARVRGGLSAMGEPAESLEVCLIQFVSLYRGGEKIPMGKRDGVFVTLRQLREEVGNDACRFFYLMRSHDQHLDFDLELAKSRSNENPVYYIQYAHARVASIARQLTARGFAWDQASALTHLGQLEGSHEQAVLVALDRYPEIVSQAARARTPHALVHYLRELANTFHTWYNAAPILVDEAPLRDARVALAHGVRQVIRNGLGLLGVSAPDSM